METFICACGTEYPVTVRRSIFGYGAEREYCIKNDCDVCKERRHTLEQRMSDKGYQLGCNEMTTMLAWFDKAKEIGEMTEVEHTQYCKAWRTALHHDVSYICEETNREGLDNQNQEKKQMSLKEEMDWYTIGEILRRHIDDAPFV